MVLFDLVVCGCVICSRALFVFWCFICVIPIRWFYGLLSGFICGIVCVVVLSAVGSLIW